MVISGLSKVGPLPRITLITGSGKLVRQKYDAGCANIVTSGLMTAISNDRNMRNTIGADQTQQSPRPSVKLRSINTSSRGCEPWRRSSKEITPSSSASGIKQNVQSSKTMLLSLTSFPRLTRSSWRWSQQQTTPLRLRNSKDVAQAENEVESHKESERQLSENKCGLSKNTESLGRNCGAH
jgi:hypothetical protein